MNTLQKIITLGLLAQFPASGFAGYTRKDNYPVTPAAQAPDEVRFIVDQTFQSDFKEGHGYVRGYEYNNNTNTWHYDFNALRRFSLENGWSMKAGVDVQRYDFGDNRSGAPNILQNYALQFIFEHASDGCPDFRLQTSPGIYFSHRLDARDFDAPTTAEWFYAVSQDVSLMGGVRLSMQSNYPVLPLAGVLWHINPNWDLDACLPAPRLVYNYSPALKIWGGGEIWGGSFHYDNQGKVDYYEVRTGAGVDYTFNQTFHATFETGAAVVRNFKMRHRVAETKPAPYVRLSFGAAF